MKGSLRVITFSHELNDAVANLDNDCQRIGVPLTVLGIGEPWNGNTLKLRLLRDFILTLVEDEILLVIDAFDVRITGTSVSILDKISELECDILFSAEANFYFHNPKLEQQYFSDYPKTGTYNFLNSGTFIADSIKLLSFIDDISCIYKVDLYDDAELLRIKSDQYLYSRLYVDNLLNRERINTIVSLDTEQNLFGCTGGAMALFNWPVINMEHQRLFFREERKLIKTFHLRAYQITSRDLKRRGSQIVNTMTNSVPDIIHLPGTYENFDSAWRLLNGNKMPIKWHFIRLISFPISLTAYIFSLIRLLVTPGQKDV